MKAQHRRRVLDVEVLHPIKALSRLFGPSSGLVHKSLTPTPPPAETIYNLECVTGGHGRCVSDECACQCHRHNTA